MLRQPAFGGITVFSEIQQFGVVGVLLKDTDGADGGSFDDLKMEIAVDGMRTQNCRCGSLLTRRATPLRFRHAASFLLKRAGGLGVPSEYRTSEPSEALS
jgi:hypothetical protein